MLLLLYIASVPEHIIITIPNKEIKSNVYEKKILPKMAAHII